MKTEIKITNDASVCTIDIEGVIGVPENEQFSDSSHSVATYERLREELDKIGNIQAKEVVVNIRSTGGDVNDALLIYESLVALDAKITTRCYGYTASAATIIAQAAGEGCREIASSALYLVHMSSSSIEGNATDLVERIDLLKKTDDRIASLYAMRSGREKEGFVVLMEQNSGRGRWLTPEEVVEAGLADTIIGVEEGSKQTGIIDKVKGWFSTSNGKEREIDAPIADINILHLPENNLPTTSSIAFEEGQNGVKGTKTSMCEDPSLEGAPTSANALAYAEDLQHLKFRRV
ncbi:MAG: Clp protease ClpP [Rikenellaceae bacterium]|nr:Clp protease ClpP [Rikenellaceae bacterium]